MKILKMLREYDSVSVIVENCGCIERRVFPSKMTNKEIEAVLLGKEYTPEEKPETPVDVAPGNEKEDIKPKKVCEDISDKRTAKARMLKMLKEHGIDTAGLLTFSAVEEVYNKHFKEGDK